MFPANEGSAYRMPTYVSFALPSTVADALDEAGVWFERVPDLGEELTEDPYNFFVELGVFLTVVGNAADLITVSVALNDIARVLKKLRNHLPSQNVTLEVRGPRGKATFELERPDDEEVAHMAAIISALAKPAIRAGEETANLPPSHQ